MLEVKDLDAVAMPDEPLADENESQGNSERKQDEDEGDGLWEPLDQDVARK